MVKSSAKMKTNKLPRILRRMHKLCKELPPKVTDSLNSKSYYRIASDECYSFKDPRTDVAKAINYKGVIPSIYGICAGDVLLAQRNKKGSINEILIAANLSDRDIKNFIDSGTLKVDSRKFEEHFTPIDLPVFRKNNKFQIATVVLSGVIVLLWQLYQIS